MAFLDHQRDSLVLRIVYDGPPFSGKTTTLRALAAGVARPVETPGEHEGRTLYFDWLDYTAGSFEGRPIRCQIVSVPGQRGLAERRRRILKDADAVVFVADTGSLGMELSLKFAADLAAALGRLDAPRPGVVVQANKRDARDADDMASVESAFRSIGIEATFIEATANTGVGVREAFLCGVRLALDRVREMVRLGTLQAGRPLIDSSGELLTSLVGDAAAAPPVTASAPTVAASGPPVAASAPPLVVSAPTLRSAEIISLPAARDEACELPHPAIPSGLIWPPVDGRLFLQQALAGQAAARRVGARGDVIADCANDWRMHSRRTDVFDNQNEGRLALTNWARLHARNADVLSGRRCLVLSPSGTRWRLWQIIGIHPSLRDILQAGWATSSARERAECMVGVGRTLLAAVTAFGRATLPLAVSIDAVGREGARPVSVAAAPGFDVENNDAALPAAAVPAQIAAVVNPWMEGPDEALLPALRQQAAFYPECGSLVAELSNLLSGERVGLA